MDGSYEGINKTILHFDEVPLHIVTATSTGDSLMLEEDLAHLLGYRGSATRHLDRGTDYLTLHDVPIRAYPVEEGASPEVRRACRVVTERGYMRLIRQRRTREPERVEWLDSMLRKSGMFLYLGWYEANGSEGPDAMAEPCVEQGSLLNAVFPPTGVPETDGEPDVPEGGIPWPLIGLAHRITVDGIGTSLYRVEVPQSGGTVLRAFRTMHVMYPVPDVALLLRDTPDNVVVAVGSGDVQPVEVEYPDGLRETWTVIESTTVYWLLRVREGLHLRLGQTEEAERLRTIRQVLDQRVVPVVSGHEPLPLGSGSLGGRGPASLSVSDVLSTSMEGFARAVRMVADGDGSSDLRVVDLLSPLVDAMSPVANVAPVEGVPQDRVDGLLREIDLLRAENERMSLRIRELESADGSDTPSEG